MKLKILAAVIVGSMVALHASVRTPSAPDGRGHGGRRDERGLSQSAETAILLAGAVVLATVVVAIITAFVKSKLPK